MPVSSYTFKILLDGKEAIATAKQIRTELQRELGQGFDFTQAKQQMANVSDLARTTGGHMGAMADQLRGATREGDRLEVDLRNADDATRAMVSNLVRSESGARQLEQALRGSEQAAENTRQQVKWLGRDLEDVAKMGRAERFGLALTAATRQTYGLRMLSSELGRVGTGLMMTGAAITGPLALAGRSYLEFADDAERAARQLKLNAELTAYLKDETLDLSASLGLFEPEEISQGLYTWASAMGAVAESQEDMNALLKDSTEIQKLAAMNQEQLGTTTEFVAATMGEFGMNTSQTNRVVEVLNYTADRTQATVGDLGQTLKFLGPTAAALGEDIEGMAAAMGVAADAGIKGSMSGRALRQMFIRLAKPTAEMNDAFNEALGLSGELGQTWQDIAFPGGKFIGLARFIDLVAASTENMTDQQRQAVLAQMATANELPVLTALVTKQIEARQEGINVLRAEEKIMRGVIDTEVEKYAEWKEATKGVTVSLESAAESWEREWQMYEDSDVARADRIQKRWDAAWKRVGEAAVETALPPLERLAELMDQIGRYAKEHPEAVGAALKTGVILAGVGALVKAASTGIRLYADVKMITAAATMYQASTNMLEAAGIQATSSKNLLGGLGGVTASLTAVGAMIAGLMYAGEKMGIPKGTQTLFAIEGETYEDYLATIQRTTQHPVKVLTEAQWEAVRAGQDLRQVIEETDDMTRQLTGAAEDTGEELRDWNVELERARRGVQGLGSDMMQLPTATGEGLLAFTEQELQAIDELESYLRRRNEMIEENNQELLDMEREFQEKEAEQYEDYLRDREKLQKELQEVTQDPLWEMTEEVQRAREREAEAVEDYNKRMADTVEQYQRKLRNLRESHEDKMEDLEARRDAKGIIRERQQYARAQRDAKEQYQDTIESLAERLQESIEKEREAIAQKREDRRKDLEEKLRELDENYAEEARRRKEDFEKRYAEKQVQNQKELQQLEQSYTEKLARIMGWEERVRDALRQSYIGREEDLRAHLAKMERAYLETYEMLSELSLGAMTPAEYRQWMEEARGRQAGGYASRGLYRLGEGGQEFVLSAPTTTALERAIGPLNQARILNLTRSSYHGRLDIHVTADDHFSPAFARQTEAVVQQQIVALATKVTKNDPGAYRPF